MSDIEFSEQLSGLLKRAGLSYRRAAAICDLSTATLWKYATGDTVPHRYIKAGILNDIQTFVQAKIKGKL